MLRSVRSVPRSGGLRFRLLACRKIVLPQRRSSGSSRDVGRCAKKPHETFTSRLSARLLKESAAVWTTPFARRWAAFLRDKGSFNGYEVLLMLSPSYPSRHRHIHHPPSARVRYRDPEAFTFPRTPSALSANIEARGLCQFPLAVVKGPKSLCLEFESAGNVQAVERADSEFWSVPTAEIGTYL